MATTHLPSDPRSARAAREFLTKELGALYEDSLRDDALLLTSELVANAVLHAHTGVELSVVTGMDTIHVEVADGSAAVPQQRSPDVDAIGGRGLALVAALAGDWGVRLAPPGKVVWFDLPVPPRRHAKVARPAPAFRPAQAVRPAAR